MENTDVARVLAEVADLLELTGGNAFKVRAYRQASQIVDLLPTPVSELWRAGKLTELPSVGERIAGHIEELLSTGRFREHDQLAGKVPPGVLELLRVEGIGPKTAALAWKKLRIKELAGLEKACRDGSLEKLPRMGPRRVAGILAALERYQARKGRVPLHRALATAEAIAERLRKVPHVRSAEVAGSIRRRRETIGDIDLLVSAAEADAVIRAFKDAPEVEALTATGPTKCTARLTSGLQADLRIVPPESFGAALHYFTGSKSHNIELRTRAMRRGLKLSEYGVFDRHGKRLGGATEEEVYRAVGLPFIPPELREGSGELEAAEEGRLPRLIEEKDVRGDLHVHSDASSDGHSTLDELCQEAERLGRQYLAITDHSRSRPLGLTGPQMRAHALEIRRFGLQQRKGAPAPADRGRGRHPRGRNARPAAGRPPGAGLGGGQRARALHRPTQEDHRAHGPRDPLGSGRRPRAPQRTAARDPGRLCLRLREGAPGGPGGRRGARGERHARADWTSTTSTAGWPRRRGSAWSSPPTPTTRASWGTCATASGWPGAGGSSARTC